MKPRLLIVDDDKVIRFTLRQLFQGEGFEIYEARDAASAKALLKPSTKHHLHPDVVLLDVQLPDQSGLCFLEALKAYVDLSQVIMMTAFGDVSQAVEAMKLGIADYVMKPFNIEDLFIRAKRVLEMMQVREHLDFLSDRESQHFHAYYIEGPNLAMKKIYKQLNIIAQAGSSTVLIRGETGTGKEVIAHRLHYLSSRAKEAFVAVNATALGAELLESELFGHEEGSFTGATKMKKGLFEVANGGTLFLDEIGDMHKNLQVKLLRALQEKTIRRVGGTENIEVDVRLLTATNIHLEKAVEEGKFREDLYYRLNVVPIFLPPLRERTDDLEAFIKHFFVEFNQEFGRVLEEVSAEALEALKGYSWPGNIRELRNVIERAVLLECTGKILERKHLKGLMNFSQLDTLEILEIKGIVGDSIPLEQVEREHIQGVLKSTRGKKNLAAKILGIDRTTLYNKLRRYSLTEEMK